MRSTVEGMLELALLDTGAGMQLKVVLACFKKNDPEVDHLAMVKLDDVEVKSTRLCNGASCMYDTAKPRTPEHIRTLSNLCRRSDANAMAASKGSIEGRKSQPGLVCFPTSPCSV